MPQDQRFQAHALKRSHAGGHQEGASTTPLPAFWKSYQVVIESLSDAVYIVDLAGQIIVGNTALVRLTAYPLAELLGRPSTEILVPEALPVLLTQHPRILEDGPVPAHLETEILRKDGYRVPVELTMTTVLDGAREVGSMSVVRDLSERYHAEARLREALESAPEAMIVVGENGRIVLANAQTEQLFGLPRAEVLGHPIERLLPEGFHASQRAQAMRMGQELYGVRKDGSMFPVEVSLSPLLTIRGLLTLNAVRDISERKRTEEAQARLAAIVVSSDDAIIGQTLEGTIPTWNQAAERLFGYEPTEVFGRPNALLVSPDCRYEMRRLFARLRRREHIEHYETVWVRKDGTPLDVSITMSPILGGRGRVIGVATIARDITARKRAQAVLQASLQEKEALLKEVHHRVKNNLAVIAGLLYLQSTYVNDAQAGETFRHCQDRVRSMAWCTRSSIALRISPP
jgi:PAS domain S-box-containing protein